MKVSDVERELRDIKSNTNNNSKFLCQQIRGQQLLTSYPGFSNGSLTEGQDEAHIKLKIEEKNQNKYLTTQRMKSGEGFHEKMTVDEILSCRCLFEVLFDNNKPYYDMDKKYKNSQKINSIDCIILYFCKKV